MDKPSKTSVNIAEDEKFLVGFRYKKEQFTWECDLDAMEDALILMRNSLTKAGVLKQSEVEIEARKRLGYE